MYSLGALKLSGNLAGTFTSTHHLFLFSYDIWVATQNYFRQQQRFSPSNSIRHNMRNFHTATEVTRQNTKKQSSRNNEFSRLVQDLFLHYRHRTNKMTVHIKHVSKTTIPALATRTLHFQNGINITSTPLLPTISIQATRMTHTVMNNT